MIKTQDEFRGLAGPELVRNSKGWDKQGVLGTRNSAANDPPQLKLKLELGQIFGEGPGSYAPCLKDEDNSVSIAMISLSE